MIPYKGKITLDKTIKYITEETNYSYKENLLNYDYSELKFKMGENSLSQLLILLAKKNLSPNSLYFVLHLCKSLCISVTSNENRNILNELIDLYFDTLNLFPEQEAFDKLFNSFNDKKIVVEYLRYVCLTKKVVSKELLEELINYVIKARQYYVDDRALFASSINLIDSIDESDLLFGSAESIKKLIDKKILEDKKANGIYNVDQFTLEELDRKMTSFEAVISKLESLVQITDNQINILKDERKISNDEMTNIKIKTLKTLKNEANKIINNFNNSYLELLSKEKENIINQRDILLADIESEIQSKKLELETLASSIGQRIAIELGRIKNLSEHSIEKIQNFVSDNEEIKKMISSVREDEAILNRLSMLNQLPIDELSKFSKRESNNSIITPTPSIAIPSIILPKKERIVDSTVNYYFDKKIPFKDRFNQLMEKKHEDIEKNGAIYHEKFDDIVTMILKGDAPYAYGPSGCGKTFMIEKQFANLIGIDVVNIGYIMYETDLIGFNDAKGEYVPSNFYRCYKFGNIVFADELDNSVASSTIILNSFLGKGDDSSYTFPGGENVKQHPNFRIIAAGNTRGNGRTVSHNTRQKLDEAVMQRLTPIEIGYDNRIEEKLLKDHPEWYNFAINFREALKKVSIDGSDGENYKGTITTRDILAIKEYKDDNSFSDDKIIEYEVIENKERDYLNDIEREMDKLFDQGKFTDGGETLLNRYKELIKRRKY